jgi:hypothetical protein
LRPRRADGGAAAWALLKKEARQHWGASIALFALLALGVLILIGNALTDRRSTSLVEVALIYLWLFVPLAGVVLGNRLIVSEYQGRTQLFLEALPIGRAQSIAIKYAIGSGFLLASSALLIELTARLAAHSEPVSSRFLAILMVRSGAFVLCVWSFLFAFGFLGRFRIPLMILAGLLLVAIGGASDVDLRRFGPFALLDRLTFPFERQVLPLGAVVVTLAIAAGLTAVGFALGLVREGSLAESLSRRMSTRERSMAGMLIFAAIVALSILHGRRAKPPYAFSGSAVLKSARVPVEVLYVDEDARADAAALLAALESDLAELRAALDWRELPPVRIAQRADLDARTFDSAKLTDADGLLVRANLRLLSGPSQLAFRAYIVREVLQLHSHGRATFEPRRWVHDGFARWWVERNAPAATSIAWARALWATRSRPVTLADLTTWTRFREEVGEPIAEGIAYSGLVSLEGLGGKLEVLALARALYQRRTYQDSRESLRELWHPMAKDLEAATGSSYASFVAAWNRALDAGRATPAARALLDRVPPVRGWLTVEPGAGDIRTVHYGFVFASAPPPGTIVSLLHLQLEPVDVELVPARLEREDHPLAAGALTAEQRLTGRYGRGERVFFALEVESPLLDTPLRVLAQRRELP